MANSFGRMAGVIFMLLPAAFITGSWLTGELDIDYVYANTLLFAIGLTVFLAYLIKDRGTIWYLAGSMPAFPVAVGTYMFGSMVFDGFRADLTVLAVFLIVIGIVLMFITLRYVDKDFKPKNMKKENDLV